MSRGNALWSVPETELHARHRRGAVPDPARYTGRLRGSLLQLEGWEHLNPVLRVLWRLVIALRLLLWRGKEFWKGPQGDLATNLVGCFRFPLKVLTMRLVPEDSMVEPGQRVLAVRYDTETNPRLVFGVRDEVVEIEDGLLLGRMVLVRAGHASAKLWFALERSA